MSFLAAFLEGAAPALGQGLLSRVFAPKRKNNFKELRDAAKEAGFNPLTALQAGGLGNAYSADPVLASSSFLAEGVFDGLKTAFNRGDDEIDRERKRLENKLLQAEIDEYAKAGQIPTEGYGFDLTQTPDLMPVLRPDPNAEGKIPIYAPNGQQFMMPQSVAAAMGYEAFDYIVAGDWAELKGEVVGEVETTLATDAIDDVVGLGKVGSRDKKPGANPRSGQATAPLRLEIPNSWGH